MTQFARPDSDDLTGGWTASGAASLWEALNESTPSDAELAISANTNNGVTRTFRVGLSDLIDPQSSSSHVVRWRASHENVLQGSTIVMRLRQGTSLVASQAESLTNSMQQFNRTLTGTEADLITDYTDLLLEFAWTKDSGLGSTRGLVSWAVLEAPDAPATPAAPMALLMG